MLSWKPKSNNAQVAAREVVTAISFMHSTFKEEIWLWRGQSDGGHNVQPGMHTRVLTSTRTPNEELVRRGTNKLISSARALKLDKSDGIVLPDLALLAALQHYGAATPLLDVTTDPYIALWMAVFSSAQNPDGEDEKAGKVFGILKPPPDRWISPLDSRNYDSKEEPSVADQVQSSYYWYNAPDVSERLKIQRGSFLLGGINLEHPQDTTMHLDLGPQPRRGEANFIEKRISRMGNSSNTYRRQSEIICFHIRPAMKKPMRALLTDRLGLTTSTIYPTPWHKPYIEQFAEAHARKRSLWLDIKNDGAGSQNKNIHIVIEDQGHETK